MFCSANAVDYRFVCVIIEGEGQSSGNENYTNEPILEVNQAGEDFYTLVTAIKSRPRYLTLRHCAFRHGLYSKAEQIQEKIYS